MPYMLSTRSDPEDDWINLEDQVFDDGPEAGQRVKELNMRHKSWGDLRRYRVVPISLEDPLAWRIREQNRFDDGTYTKAPWADRYTTYVYEHIDPDDPTKIRYFDSDRQRYTSMTPGKFFLRFVDSYPRAGVVEAYCAQMGLDMIVSKLLLAQTADEFEYVYTSGPHSCMAYEFDKEKFHSPFHPVRVYGDLDLACAYITRGGDITARCLVWPEKKIFGRIYGDKERIKERLKEEGYTEDWDFSGARLHLVRSEDGRIVAPYVDGNEGAKISDDGQYLVLDNEAFIVLKDPEGFVSATACGNCAATDTHLQWEDDHEDYVCGDCL